MGFKFFLWMLLAPSLLFGFRVIPGFQSWSIDNTSTTNSKLFLVYSGPSDTFENDFPSDDVLAGSGTLSRQQLVNSILNDFTNIAGSYLTLVDSSDPDFATRGTDRTITIVEGDPQSVAGGGGYARPTIRDGKMVGCDVVLTAPLYRSTSAKEWTLVVTHEIGHCLGLNHAMDTTNSIMSYYYADRQPNRLQIDDKMGIVYLYPVDPSGARELPTLGLACSRAR